MDCNNSAILKDKRKLLAVANTAILSVLTISSMSYTMMFYIYFKVKHNYKYTTPLSPYTKFTYNIRKRAIPNRMSFYYVNDSFKI